MLLSIIIPVYKTEKFIRQCLDSCLNQDIAPSEYEIICVDDGSPDQCGRILDEYCSKYANVSVIHKENGGVSSARNIGIEHAQGDYIWFIDSDDFIEFNSLATIKEYINCYNKDIYIVGAYRFKSLSTDVFDIAQKDDIREEISGCYGAMIIYKRVLVIGSGIRFMTNINYAEDLVFEFAIKHAYSSLKEMRINRCIYYYRDNPVSLSHADPLKTIISFIGVLQIMCEYRAEHSHDTLSAEYYSTLYYYKVIQLYFRLPFDAKRKYRRLIKQNAHYKPDNMVLKWLQNDYPKIDNKQFALAPAPNGIFRLRCMRIASRFKKLFRKK